MNEIIVDVMAALICFASTCHHALIGVDTPKGVFHLQHYQTDLSGYGGDVLVFDNPPDKDYVFAIHRVLNISGQRRFERIKSENPADRSITLGCINVMPDIYDQLIDCCSNATLIIK